ncbi:alpha-L-fucosidase [Flammeovirgaceae bacterium SG7u.111]|nr:alpha-L-fucosidase [Flammeovirgaceae bacterium SG7u.132]WPO33869.1 alpha-L-fucosidase [Flammeovirgaceae bacterium SG7u.111]
MKRRKFIQLTGMGVGTAMTPSIFYSCSKPNVPSYLGNYAKLYTESPLDAATKWFVDAKYGLFLHYGVYSLLGRGEWVQYREKIHVKEYEKLKDKFTAEKFDAETIADLAVESEMKYINITTRHHDSFCLFNTKTTDFNSVQSPAKRDLVEELANACDKRGLGLCLYYSHGRDWRHPHAANNDNWGGLARPLYETEEPYYKYGDEHDLNLYIEYMHDQLTELLTNYGSIASIWFDGHGVPVNGPTEKFRIEETYQLIRKLQPQCLISAKWGYLGTEDYLSPEYHWLANNQEKTKEMLDSGKPVEICTHIAGWGYTKKNDGKHRGADSIIENLRYAKKYRGNLLLNTGPLPDGSIDKQDVASMKAVGKIIRNEGWPS